MYGIFHYISYGSFSFFFQVVLLIWSKACLCQKMENRQMSNILLDISIPDLYILSILSIKIKSFRDGGDQVSGLESGLVLLQPLGLLLYQWLQQFGSVLWKFRVPRLKTLQMVVDLYSFISSCLVVLFGLLKRKQDNSRESASLLFPSLSSQLKRKKDHGKDLVLEVPFSFRMCFYIYVWKVMTWFYNIFSAWRTSGSTPYSSLWERDFSSS